MPVTQERILKLQGFGLSEYVARAYLALLDLGPAEARDVATLGKVPIGKVYQALDQLHRAGLAEILPENPKRFAPLAFESYLRRLRDEHESAMRALEKESAAVADEFRITASKELADRGDFTVVRGRRNVVDRLAELVRGTEREWIGAYTRGFADRGAWFVEAFRAARARGARARLLVPVSAETHDRLAPLADHAELRACDPLAHGDGVGVTIVVRDRATAMIVNFAPDDASPSSAKDVALVTDQEGVVRALASILESRWRDAAPFDATRRAVVARRAIPFTRLYRSQADVLEAHARATRGSVAEIVYACGAPHTAVGKDAIAAYDAHLADARRQRWLLNLTTLAAVDVISVLVAKQPTVEVRHLAASTFGRFWVVDGREAFVGLASQPASVTMDAGADPRGVADDCAHTSDESTVAGLLAHFEELWARATPLAARRKELVDR